MKKQKTKTFQISGYYIKEFIIDIEAKNRNEALKKAKKFNLNRTEFSTEEITKKNFFIN